MSGVLILGAGGHAKVVADILRLCGKDILGFLDDDSERWGKETLGIPVLGAINEYARYRPSGLVLGIGLNSMRRTIAQRLESSQHLWINAIHPCATVALSSVLGRGVVVAAHAVVNPDSVVGNHVILNTGSTVDHDCRIKNFVHVAPGCHLAGGVVVEEGAFIGIGTAVIPGVTIGNWSTIGAGSVVLRDVPAQVTVYGVPAQTACR